MYTYCMNNPTNRIDTSGRFWKEIGDFFKGIANTITSFFSTASQVSVVTEQTDYVTSDISPISVKTGTTISTVTSSKGNASKPVSVYANGVSNEPVTSTAGIKINIKKCSLDFGVGLTDTSLKFLISNGNITTSSAFKVDITKMQIGFEMEVEEKIATDVYASGYANASISGGFLMATYALINSGNFNSSFQYAY